MLDVEWNERKQHAIYKKLAKVFTVEKLVAIWIRGANIVQALLAMTVYISYAMSDRLIYEQPVQVDKDALVARETGKWNNYNDRMDKILFYWVKR